MMPCGLHNKEFNAVGNALGATHLVCPDCEALKKREAALLDCINRIANRCRSKSYDSILQDAEAALNARKE